MQLLPSAGCFRSWLAPLAASALVFLTAQPFRLSGQVTADAVAVTKRLPVFTSAREAVATVTERGPHHRVEQWVERIIGEDGTTNDVTHSATVLANGLHYLDGGEWMETVPEFVAVNGGWLAARGPHQVLVSERLFVAGAVTVVAPEGQTWRSTPMTLALRDRAGGQVWVLGESRDVAGELVAPNTVLFRDAFAGEAGVKADVRVVTSSGGVECDVIVRSGVPTREALGEAGENAELVVLTEIFEPGGATANPVDRGGRSDDVVRLGALTMDQGKAFGTDLPGEPARSVPVFKRVYQDAATGRVFLEEATPLDSLTPLLEALPEARVPGPAEARWRNMAGGKTRPPGSVAGSTDFPVRRLGLAPAPTLPRRADGRFEVATTANVPRTFAAVKSQPGVVLDWSYLNSATNFTFRGDTTYYVTNAVTLSGTNVTWEAGTVVKFANTGSPNLWVSSTANLDWQAEPFRPITFTAKDDDTVGDKIIGSSGNPSGTYAVTALALAVGSIGRAIEHARFRHAALAIAADDAGQSQSTFVTLRSLQIANCAEGFYLNNTSAGTEPAKVQNVLAVNVGTLFADPGKLAIETAFVTLDQVTNLWLYPIASSLAVKDSVLNHVGGTSGASLTTCSVHTSTNLFERVGAGTHYLPGQSQVRETVASQALASLDARLASATTLAPLVLTNVTASLTLSPWQTAGDAYTLGYHYDPVDWYASNVVVTNATLTLTNGVTVALGGTKGFQLDSGGLFVSTGSPLARNRLVGASFVQEGTNGVTASSFSLFSPGAGATSRPTVNATFTDLTFSGPGKTLLSDQNCALASLTLADSRLFRAHAYVLPPATNLSQTITLQNNVLEGADLGFHHYYDSNFGVTFRHNLLRRGNLLVYYASQATDTQHPTWTLKDNLFDSATLQLTTVAYGNYYVAASHNGYTGSTATFGGSGNKTSLTAGYVTGPLGRFYYPATGASGSLTNLLDAGSVTDASTLGFYHHTTLAAGPREGTGRLDIGFHYPLATAADALADTDQDGLSDWAEDANLNGVVNTGETDPNNADSDQDGALDGEELAAGTDPNSTASWIPKRLAAWWWDTSTGNWKNGDRGQAPLVDQNGNPTNGVVAGGIHFPLTGATPLRYAVRESNGRLNARLDQGSLKLWLKPDWVWTNRPMNSPRLFEVGERNNTTKGWWAWLLATNYGDASNVWRNQLWQNNGAGISARYYLPLNESDWTTVSWHPMTLVYTPEYTGLYHQGRMHYLQVGSAKQYTCDGILTAETPPVATQTNDGFSLGSDGTGAYARLGAAVDSLEAFNYPHGNAERFTHQQLTIQIETNGASRHLKFVRGYEGGSITNGASEFRAWPLTLWRRGLGSTNWGTHLFTNSLAATWTDTNVTVGTTYEYKAQLLYDGSVPHVRHFFAGVAMLPQHQRGNVILLVDSTLEPSLTNELATLRTNLVGDGWTVRQATAPRHHDTIWLTNRLNLTNVVNLIASNTVAGTTNVVFIVGHVTIPYSGVAAEDGHTPISPPDHRGAWVADAYYGYLSKSGWTDNNSWSNPSNAIVNLPNDGKFDPDYLIVTPDNTNYARVGRLPDMAVGRLDFARLPAFSGLTEVDLVKRYLAKETRYRVHVIPTFGRVSAFLGNYAEPHGANLGQSLAGAAFGAEPGRFFNGANLRQRMPADLGIHHSTASAPDTGVYDDQSIGYSSSNFADPAKEVPVTFRNVWFSWACDWARLDEFNRFQRDDNWLRASLGWTNHGLATVGGYAWDFAPLGSGAPLAAAMTHGWEGQPWVPRFQSILGDPTLRLHRVTPPTAPKASRSGSTVTLGWNHSPEMNCRYYVYRSTNGLDGFGSPLNLAPTPALSFTDTTTTTNLLYQIRAATLQVTGSGSFTNLSQGIFINVP